MGERLQRFWRAGETHAEPAGSARPLLRNTLIDRLDSLAYAVLGIHLLVRGLAERYWIVVAAGLVVVALCVLSFRQTSRLGVLARSVAACWLLGVVVLNQPTLRLELLAYCTSLGILTALLVGLRLSWPAVFMWGSVVGALSWGGLDDFVGGLVRVVTVVVGSIVSGILADRRIVAEAIIDERERHGERRHAANLAIVSAIDSSPIGVIMHDREERIIYSNPHASKTLGISSARLVEEGWHAVLDAVNADRVRGALNEAGRGQVVTSTVEFDHGVDGGLRWIDVLSGPLIDASGASSGTFSAVRDITVEREARQTMERLRAIAEITTDIVGICDLAGEVLFINPQGRAFYALDGSESMNVMRMMTPDSERRVLDEILPLARVNGAWTGELELVGPDDVVVPMSCNLVVLREPGGGAMSFAAVFRDFTEHRQLEDRLEFQARHDPLTSLPNRVELYERISSLIAGSVPFAVLFCDLDGFKPVNDSLGHQVGDRLLQIVGARLRDACREADTVGRLGGDEFVVLCRLDEIDPADHRVATDLARRLIEVVAQPIDIEGRDHELSMSIGLTVAVRGEGREELIEDADIALYRAKRTGTGQIVVYDESMRRDVEASLDLEQALRAGLVRKEFVAYFQPVVELSTRRIVHLEALVRWQRGDEVVVAESFIGASARAGLLDDIAIVVLHECIRSLHLLRAHGHAVTVGMNLSPDQLYNADLLRQIVEQLVGAGLDDQSLTIEITEDAVAADVAVARGVLLELRRRGLRIALDDFGTGYSNLAALRRLPVDVLKIDREFTDGLFDDSGDRQIVKLLTAMASELDLAVVAEGVETPEQAERLMELGCEFGQGYHFGLAQPIDELVEYFDSGRVSTIRPAQR